MYLNPMAVVNAVSVTVAAVLIDEVDAAVSVWFRLFYVIPQPKQLGINAAICIVLQERIGFSDGGHHCATASDVLDLG